MTPLLLSLLLASGPATPPPATVAKSVLRVESQGRHALEAGTCSAVVLAWDLAITAAHCVDGDDIDVTIDNHDATVLKVNRILDLALLGFLPNPDLVPLALATKTPGIGAEAIVVGFAFGKRDLHVQFGYVSDPLDEGHRLVLNADLIAGDSGGAVLDRDGHVIGVVSAVEYEGVSHLGEAIPVETIHDFVIVHLVASALKAAQ